MQFMRDYKVMRFWIRASLFSCLGISFLIALGMRFLNEDLLVALCSGRDTLAGLLGKPDQWSFTMPGKIWVDQSWLTHLIYYLSYSMLEELGPVLLKGLLLALCLVVLCLRCRSLGAGLDATVTALVLGTLALAPFLQIRAENFGVLYFLVFASLLTAPASWGRWRLVGCLVILAVWSNSHGSFLLGLVLLGLRVVVEILCSSKSLAALIRRYSFQANRLLAQQNGNPTGIPPSNIEGTHKLDVLGWLVTWVVSVAIVALFNPYGPANALLPFRQLSASRMTSQSADWIPLLDRNQFWQHGFLQPLDVTPFLLLLAITGGLVAAALVSNGIREKLGRRFTGKMRPEVLMEVLIPLLLLVMAFRFRRMILFAAPALVPAAAVLLQVNLDALTGRFDREGRSGRIRIMRLIAGGALTVCLLVMGEQFSIKTVVPYMPSNPVRHDRPVTSQLMSFDAYALDVVRFMKDNGIKGRMLTSWTAGAFLLFSDPKIKVFMDARDQSFYSDEIIELYFSIMNSRREDIPRTLEVLDRYQVSYAVLATNVGDFDLATLLMETRKWACIYKDDEFLLLARSDSEKIGPSSRSLTLNTLQYRSDDTRLLSEAVRSQFMTGKVPPELLTWLQDYCRHHPDPDLYSLITLAINGKSPCLCPEARSFLMSEVQRLAGMDYMVAAGATSIVKSLIIVAGILEGDELRCHAGTNAQTYSRLRKGAARIYAELEAKYRGY
jgi:hypothetical protein